MARQSKLMTIAIYFHIMRYRDFKHYYLFHICRNISDEFPQLVSYYRFVELMKSVLLPLIVYLKTQCLGKCTGISHIKREHSHKVLRGLAAKGHCIIGWFFGLKLHFVINYKVEILDFVLTPGNVNDRKPLANTNLLSRIYGKLFGDKGYISQSLFEQFFIDGIHLITKLIKNIKNSLMHISEKNLLRKPALVETLFDELKNIYQIEHTRQRSPEGFIINLISGLIAYCQRNFP